MSSFPCLKCGADTRVTDSRNTKRDAPGPIRRRRKCLSCENTFKTYEVADVDAVINTKKIRQSLLAAKGLIASAMKEAGIAIESSQPKAQTMPRIKWTPEMDAKLIELRSQNHSYLDCSEAIGVYYVSVMKRCRALGIGGRRNCGRIPGRLPSEKVHDLDPALKQWKEASDGLD